MPEQTDIIHDGSGSGRRLLQRLALGSLIVLLGVVAFAGSLVFYMPVRFAAHQAGLPDDGPLGANRLSGTVWTGQLQIDSDHDLTWTIRPGASLLAFGIAADWRVTGPGTDFGGRGVVRRGGAEVGPFSGDAGWPLVAATLPGLSIFCTGQARFSAVNLGVNGSVRTASGVVTAPAGNCARSDGSIGPVPTPALHAQISTAPDAIEVLVTPQTGPRVALLTARLTTQDRLAITIHRAGAELVPGMPSTSDTELDLPLSVILGM